MKKRCRRLPQKPKRRPRPSAGGFKNSSWASDSLNYSEENPDPRYDRPLTLEVWYPAIRPGNKPEVTTYQDVLGSGPDNPDRPLIPFEFAGRALRNAKPNFAEGAYPLIIVSHGYPGSRVLLTYLTENLASKGYVVVAIDHTDSTHADANNFWLYSEFPTSKQPLKSYKYCH